MSILSNQQLSNGNQLGLWRIDETSKAMLDRRPQLAFEIDSYRNEVRRQERLSVYELLFLMTGDQSLRLSHDDSGKPLLDCREVSISHTKGYVAVLLAHEGRVGVDIEYRSDRVLKVASRFLRDDEHAPTPDAALLHWCAKEAVYKYFSEQHLELQQMKVHPFELQKDGQIIVSNLLLDTTVSVGYHFADDYCLAYTL